MRQPEPRRLGEGGEVQRLAKAKAVSQQGVQCAGDDQADQDQQTLQHPAGKYRHYADAEHGQHRHPAVEGAGGDAAHGNRRQVQADSHHHRAGHHRRHQALDPAGADLHHHQTNQGVNQPAGDDPAKGDAQMRVQPLAVKAGNGDHHPDKGGAGAEIARHPSAGDDKEQQGADARHQNRQVGVEPHQQRHQHRRAEHRNGVLHAHHQRLPGRQAFIGRNNAGLSGGGGQLPARKIEECHDDIPG
ncbi:Uncharacterised protein [Klebsiella quasivariicola]|nr:Uncharacterised protein [Klebsiella quasivariicola]